MERLISIRYLGTTKTLLEPAEDVEAEHAVALHEEEEGVEQQWRGMPFTVDVDVAADGVWLVAHGGGLVESF